MQRSLSQRQRVLSCRRPPVGRDPMRLLKLSVCPVLIVLLSAIVLLSQSRNPANAVLFEGARLIIGDGRTIEDGVFVVQAGHITALGTKGTLSVPAGATRVDLSGKTVMP